jgi:hypothetical protein
MLRSAVSAFTRVMLGRESINLPGGRLARVRYAPIADMLLHSNEMTRCANSVGRQLPGLLCSKII